MAGDSNKKEIKVSFMYILVVMEVLMLEPWFLDCYCQLKFVVHYVVAPM